MIGNISIWQLLIVLGIIILIFGTKKLRNIGSDLGGAVKGFKKAMNEDVSSKKDNADQDSQRLEKESTEDAQFNQSSPSEAKNKDKDKV